MFTFHASAVGFGGVVTTPRRAALSSVASAVLPPTGGQDSALEQDYNRDGVRFTRAYTSVYGATSPDNLKFTTKTEMSIIGLSMFDVLEIDSLSATLMSVRTVQPADDPNEEPIVDEHFTVTASIDGARVLGTEVDTTMDPEFFATKPTYDSFMRWVCDPAVLQEELHRRFAWGERRPRHDAEVVRCTLLQPSDRAGMLDAGRGIERVGNRIRVPGVGDIFLGEMLVKRGMRKLNLVRLELKKGIVDDGGIEPLFARAAGDDAPPLPGDGQNGSFTSGSGEANGTPTYP